MTDRPTNGTNDDNPNPTRRKMLMRLGLAAGAIYAAPALVNLGEARASGGSRGSGRRRRGRGGFDRAS